MDSKSYKEACRNALEDPEDYWAKEAENLVWFKKWDQVLDQSRSPFNKWFVGGLMNTCYNCLDRHVAQGLGDKVALIYDCPFEGLKDSITYTQLLKLVSQIAWVLRHQLSVQAGDRVMILMPRTVEGLACMLACTRLGATHATLYTDLPVNQIVHRLDLLRPVAVLTSTYTYRNGVKRMLKKALDEAIDLASWKPGKCLLFRRKDSNELVDQTFDRDIVWQDLKVEELGEEPCHPLEATQPLYILQTSGTTGAPKAVVIPTGGFAVGVLNQLRSLFGTDAKGKEEVFFTTSELGWAVSHNYLCFGNLLAGTTSLIYEGEAVGSPDASAFFRLVEEHKLTRIISNLSIFRIIRNQYSEASFGKKYNLSSLRSVMVTGEYADLGTMLWVSETFKVPVVNCWGQTETGCFITSVPPELGGDLEIPCVIPTSLPLPGYNIQVLRPDMTSVDPGETGKILSKLPLPPGVLCNLFEREELCLQTYYTPYPGYFDTKDEGCVEPDGSVRIIGRTDDMLKVGTLPIIVSSLEEMILKHSRVSEVVVVPLPDPIKNFVPLAVYTLRDDLSNYQDMDAEIKQLVVENYLGNTFLRTAAVSALPRTFSGKIAKNLVKAVAKGVDITDELNEKILQKIKEEFRKQGII